MQNRRLTVFGHLPLNHPLRGFYRTLLAGGGILLVLFGILWVVMGSGDGVSLLGLHGNSTFGVVILIVGAALVVAVARGRNADHWTGFTASVIVAFLGFYGLAMTRTTPEPFHQSLGTCLALLILSFAILLSALYVGTGTDAEQRHRQFAGGRLTAAEYTALHRED